LALYEKKDADKLLEEARQTLNEAERKGNHIPKTMQMQYNRISDIGEEIGVMIYFFVKDKDFYHSYLDACHPYVYFPLEFDRIDVIEKNGVKINIITPTDKYLTWVFGNWRKPGSRKSYLPSAGKYYD
jgi:hypothetical protein